MKYWLVLGVALLTGCVSRPTTPSAHVVINRGQTVAGNNYWRPSAEDIAALEAELSRLWEKPDERANRRSEFPLNDYVVRYFGTIEGGKRVVIGEGLRPEAKDAAERHLLVESDEVGSGHVVLHAFGGGDFYFTVRYDPEIKRVTQLRFNASL